MLLDFVNLAIRLEMELTPLGILEDIMFDKARDSVYLHVEVTISTSPTSVFNALLLASDVQIVLPQVAVVVSQDMCFIIYNALQVALMAFSTAQTHVLVVLVLVLHAKQPLTHVFHV